MHLSLFIMRALAIWLLVCSLVLPACTPSNNRPAKKPETPAEPDPYSKPCLVDISQECGLVFKHSTGPLDGYPMPQIMGSGACLFDFDGDSDLDVFMINGASHATDPSSTGSRLFQQEPPGKFIDVTQNSGIQDTGYGMGAAVGDVDNDGDLDLYVTRYGEDSLYINQGGGRFRDATIEAGVQNPKWATAASFFDYDRDGWLDLFVVNYVDFFPGSICEDGSGRRDFCGPESLQGTVHKLYRNLGQPPPGQTVRFEDVTVASGIARRTGKGLGVLCRDFDGDSLPDILIANDGEENTLWMQHEGGVFSNEALLRGIALNRSGEAEANMGVIADDLNGDGSFDVVITHLREESTTVFRGATGGQFMDETISSGLAVCSLPFTGFGITSNDFDNDGDLDLAIVNGGVKRGPATDASDVDSFWKDYAQRNVFYQNDGRGRFKPLINLGGSDYARRVEVSRALGSGDIDNDGDIDLLVSNCAGPARLYRNDFPKSGAWLTVSAIDPQLNRQAIGAVIQVRAGSDMKSRELNPSSSYLSCNDMRVHFGLGDHQSYDTIRVQWPSGSTAIEEFDGGQSNRFVTLVRGQGRVIGAPSP